MEHAAAPDESTSESRCPGPYPVGAYAAQLKRRCRSSRGSSWSARCGAFAPRGRGSTSSCVTRTARCRARCGGPTSSSSACRSADGLRVVAGGGCDYYPGSATSSPSFSFAVTRAAPGRRGRPARPAASGCAAGSTTRGCSSARSDSRCRRCRARSGSSPASRARPATTCSPGCVAAAGPGGWCGRSPRSRTATRRRAIAASLRELAAIAEVEVVIVARGGGSLADLFAFCDEGLCRTVALLRVPVISSVGHHTDRTLIDDVAAVCCSTPTHAAEAAVPIDCRAARAELTALARRLTRSRPRRGRSRGRARWRSSLARPSEHVARNRRTLHQLTRELRASARRNATRGAELGRRPRARPAAQRRPGAGPRARPARTRARAAGAGARRARSGAHAGPRLRAGHRPRRDAARRPRRRRATPGASGSAFTTARCRPRSTAERRASERRAHAPTSRPSAGSRRSSAGWTPVTPACARRSTSWPRGASWSSTVPPSSTPSARASTSCKLEELVTRLQGAQRSDEHV